MITAQKIYFVSEDEEVFEYAYLNAVGNVNVSGLISDTIKETKFAIPICSKKWLFAQDLDNVFIVVADNKEMLNIIKELLKKGLQFVENWIPYWMYNSCEISAEKMLQLVGGNKERFANAMNEIKKKKQVILIHGNCQTHAMRYYLKQNEEIAKRYVLVEMPQLWNAGHKEKYDKLFDVDIFSYVDILITQIVSKDNKFAERVSTEHILSLVNPECKVITISNAFFNGYYPQFCNDIKYDKNKVAEVVNEKGLSLYWGRLDYVVAEKVIEGKSVEEIIESILDEDFYDRKWLYNYIYNGINYTKAKEQNCDIKICEYIESKLNKEILFTTSMHPGENLMVFMRENFGKNRNKRYFSML